MVCVPTGRIIMAVALLLAAALPLAMVGGTPLAAATVMRMAERPSPVERVLDEANVHAGDAMPANKPMLHPASTAGDDAAVATSHFCKEESSVFSKRDADSAARPAREGHHGTMVYMACATLLAGNLGLAVLLRCEKRARAQDARVILQLRAAISEATRARLRGSAAYTIQLLWRAHLLLKEECAAVIQDVWREQIRRRYERAQVTALAAKRHALELTAAVIIQSYFRVALVAAAFEDESDEWAERVSEAVQINLYFVAPESDQRAVGCLSLLRSGLVWLREQAVCLQAAARGLLARALLRPLQAAQRAIPRGAAVSTAAYLSESALATAVWARVVFGKLNDVLIVDRRSAAGGRAQPSSLHDLVKRHFGVTLLASEAGAGARAASGRTGSTKKAKATSARQKRAQKAAAQDTAHPGRLLEVNGVMYTVGGSLQLPLALLKKCWGLSAYHRHAHVLKATRFAAYTPSGDESGSDPEWEEPEETTVRAQSRHNQSQLAEYGESSSESSEEGVGPPSGLWPWEVRSDAAAA